MEVSLQKQKGLIGEAKRLTKKYHTRKDILDIQLGFKKTRNKLTREISIRFHVPQKIPLSRLERKNILPKKIGKFKTDVVDYAIKLHSIRSVEPYENIDPVIGGIEIQSDLFDQRSDWGTIGCILNVHRISCGITNYHVVFGNLDESQVKVYINTLRIFQPNKPNGGNAIGVVSNIFSNNLDYCIFKLTAPSDRQQSVNKLKGIVSRFANITIGTILAKSGAASGLTFGKVESISLQDPSKIIISYEPVPGNESSSISLPGDSGSVWVILSKEKSIALKLAALHYGGDDNSNVAFATLFSSIIPSINNKTFI